MTIPVVFIHRGDQAYLHHTTARAAAHNREVVLIGGSTTLEHLPIEDYLGDAPRFEASFVNLSSSADYFERRCIERWFILQEYMKRHEVDVCFYSDSDVLLYADVNAEWPNWSQWELTVVAGSVPGNSYFTRRGIDDFCEYVLHLYEQKGETYQLFERIFAEMQEKGLPGGICDMTLFHHYAAAGRLPVGEMIHIVDGTIWDHNINCDDGFRMCDWESPDFSESRHVKDLRYEDGRPFGWLLSENTWVRFNSVHFGGAAQVLIPEFDAR